jgi:hypothetical protein
MELDAVNAIHNAIEPCFGRLPGLAVEAGFSPIVQARTPDGSLPDNAAERFF